MTDAGGGADAAFPTPANWDTRGGMDGMWRALGSLITRNKEQLESQNAQKEFQKVVGKFHSRLAKLMPKVMHECKVPQMEMSLKREGATEVAFFRSRGRFWVDFGRDST